jgi:hypothetical protein
MLPFQLYLLLFRHLFGHLYMLTDRQKKKKHRLKISLDLWPVSRDGTGRARGDVGRAKRFPVDIVLVSSAMGSHSREYRIFIFGN